VKTLINDGLKFVCGSEAELWRARTLFTKEPGTIQWLQQLRSGDVFYDIGANVGCYTLLAARLVGVSGHVVAVEPHPANAAALIRNITANGFANVTVLTTPLGATDGFQRLRLGSAEAGSSGSTAGQAGLVLTYVATIDRLIAEGVIPPPSFIKVDVDGNEPLIVVGMVNTLSGWNAPRSLQIESAPRSRDVLEHNLRMVRYHKVEAHYTHDCQRQIDAGIPAGSVIENSIFLPGAA
jgi:FkbM family methyltransferase